jgi:hypothetical protein
MAARTSAVCLFLAVISWRQLAMGDNWQENVRPKLFAVMTSRDYQSFVGNPQVPIPRISRFSARKVYGQIVS